MKQLLGIETWEDEGGAGFPSPAMKGTAAQVEWAERIQRTVVAEFDRVAAAFRAVALRQAAEKRADTEAILAVLATIRAEVMSIDSAGSLIRHWQEIGDQVRDLILQDPRYREIARRRAARRQGTELGPEVFDKGRST
jgi:hypothetical protein